MAARHSEGLAAKIGDVMAVEAVREAVRQVPADIWQVTRVQGIESGDVRFGYARIYTDSQTGNRVVELTAIGENVGIEAEVSMTAEGEWEVEALGIGEGEL